MGSPSDTSSMVQPTISLSNTPNIFLNPTTTNGTYNTGYNYPTQPFQQASGNYINNNPGLSGQTPSNLSQTDVNGLPVVNSPSFAQVSNPSLDTNATNASSFATNPMGQAAANLIGGTSSSPSSTSASSSSSSSSSPLSTLSDIYNYGKNAYNLATTNVSDLVDSVGSFLGLTNSTAPALDASTLSSAAGLTSNASSIGSLTASSMPNTVGEAATNALGPSSFYNGGVQGLTDSQISGIVNANYTNGVSTSASAGSGTEVGSSALGTTGAGLGTAGMGFTAGNLTGGAVGSPGGGAAAGAASGAATGALAGTYIFPVIGTAIGALIGALGGAIGGALGGQHPTVGPNATASIKDWNSQTARPDFITSSDNGGSAGTAQQMIDKSYNDLNSIVKNAGGTMSNVAPMSMGYYKGKYFVSDNTTGSNANYQNNQFATYQDAEKDFIYRELQRASTDSTGLSQDKLDSLQGMSGDDIAKSLSSLYTNVTNSPSPQQSGPTDWYQAGTQLNIHPLNYDRGGFVEGPGGPTDDKIPAKLSNGEFVIPADVVNKLGGGDNNTGAEHLTSLISRVRGPDAKNYSPPKNVDANAYNCGGLINSTNRFDDSGYNSRAQGFMDGGAALPILDHFSLGGMVRKTGHFNKGISQQLGGNASNLEKGYALGGLVSDNISNDDEQPPSVIGRRQITKPFGTPTRDGQFAINDYNVGGLIKRPQPPNANYVN